MKNSNNIALFIVNSPFQCLCMLEAIQFYSIENFDVILRPDAVEKNNQMVHNILESKGISYQRIELSHLIKDIFPLLLKKKKKYNRFFLGDYFDGGITAYIYALLCACPKAQITYLDDGTKTFRIFSTPPYPRIKNWKVAVIVRSFEIFKVIKRIKKPSFFTIFSVKSDKYVVDKNTLQVVREKIPNTPPNGIFIIGTNFLDEGERYISILKQLLSKFKKEYPKQAVYYCPHRRNQNNIDLLSLLESENVRVFETEVTVEYDFVEKGINPMVIIGFGSTALFTLKTIYKDSIVYNINFYIKPDCYRKVFDTLAAEQNIKTIQ